MERNNRVRNQARPERLEIVAELYKRGWTYRKMKAEIDARLNCNVSLATLVKDVKRLLEEWREYRLDNVDDYIQLELARIDDACAELWDQWEKSKEDYTKTNSKRVGVPVDSDGSGEGSTIATIKREQSEQNMVGLGNPAYIAEIRQQLIERRKLLGLYAAEKKEIIGNASSPLVVQNMTEAQIKEEIERIKANRAI